MFIIFHIAFSLPFLYSLSIRELWKLFVKISGLKFFLLSFQSVVLEQGKSLLLEEFDSLICSFPTALYQCTLPTAK